MVAINSLNIKTVFKVVAGGITVVSISEVLSRWSTFDQLVTAFNSCVLPAGTGLVQLTEGCVCLTVRAETLSALTTLWNLYQDGTLETRLYNFFVTDEIRELAGGEEVEVNVTIEEQEYEKACLEFINEAQGNSILLYLVLNQLKRFIYLLKISADLHVKL
ncbi:CCR4-NOT transcription complex subunit 6-like [Desmophyllum pertusum]|uniref:CCR4-NOT transcription complex subunit 6-like n=1 Tax=Desmophyllum pertusum TaxID=174260 RepID=A0A9W9ZC98_9CNID|nr:CCR4-NOT transcription complex subunit 6-like [Desmophyllum pertusum]